MWHYQKTIKTEDSFDVVITGGGIAGVCAAIAAAKAGVKTLLIEQFSTLGGAATTGGTAAFCGETKGQGYAFDQIIKHLEAAQAIREYKPYVESEARPFDHEALKYVLQEICLQHKVHLLMHTRVVDVFSKQGKAEGVLIHNQSGLQVIACKSLIDCSGEALTSVQTGFTSLNEENALATNLPMSLNFFMRKAEGPIQQKIPCESLGTTPIYTKEDDLPAISIWPQKNNKIGIKMKLPGYLSTNGYSLSQAEIEAQKQMWGVIHYLQRNPIRKFNLCDYVFDYASPILGIREGRRIKGKYVLTGNDVKQGKTFSDAIGVGVFYLDYMNPISRQQVYAIDWKERHIPPYQIPLGCLIPEGSQNVLIAGRCLSAERLAMSSARVMTTCAMMGQAIGLAATQILNGTNTVNDINSQTLQNELMQSGSLLDTSCYQTLAI